MMALMIIAFFLQAIGTSPVVPPTVTAFLLDLLRYLVGLALAAIAGTSIKLWKDNQSLKKDVVTLQEQRKADLIERNDLLTIAHAIKNESKSLKAEFDMKLKDVMHHFSEQQNEDRGMMKDMIHEVKLTLTELNTTIKGIQARTK